MSIPDLFTEEQIRDGLENCLGWERVGETIERRFKFKNFIEALSWMVGVGVWAEKLNHHPDWSNVYSTVNVSLTTHDCGGLSELDFRLATKMNELYGK